MVNYTSLTNQSVLAAQQPEGGPLYLARVEMEN